MENTVIPKSNMMAKKAIEEPTDIYTMIGSDKWRFDFGLKKEIILKCGQRKAEYIFREQTHRPLWDLVTYCDRDVADAIITHYGYPQPKYFIIFMRWVYNWVAPANGWVCPKNYNQMSFFPYASLYKNYLLAYSNAQTVEEK